jgi:hypothetical protein
MGGWRPAGSGKLLLASPPGDPSTRVVWKRALPHLAHKPEVRAGLLSEARWTQTVRSPHGERSLVARYGRGIFLD